VDQQQSTLFTIAEDVKIQIEFNPLKVESYRLLGYENRILAAADFSDDTKDAGEIGAGHSVTALYEIIPAGPEAASDESSALRYQTSRINEEIAGSGELGFIQFRYKNPGEDQSRLISSPIPGNPTPFGKASSNLQFAATVAEWGSLLRGSEYGDKDPLERLMATAGANLGEDRFGYRREFLELLVKTDEILTARGGRENPAR
jgi:Ca-activated chloride channel family protein